ncbi:uncharacterized protein LOC141853391 [Brevipalpus obovatus]|uniref:uncharacterized protein LOC141853391 n=1 Tax=Brevipalpus obovatus TaxID=246614 RepID=UPI003D9EE45F
MLPSSSARWRVHVRSRQKLSILLNSRFLSSESESVDHYGTLDINSNSNQREIKNAYYKLSKQYHPDRNPGAADKFRKINEAYEILSDVDSRRDYDRSRAGWKSLQKVSSTPKSTGFTKPTKLDKEDIARMFRERMTNNQKNGTSEDRTRYSSWQENTSTQQGFSENMSSMPFNGPLLSEETLTRSKAHRRNSSEPANIIGSGGRRINIPLDPNVFGLTVFVSILLFFDLTETFVVNYPSLTDSKTKDGQTKS